VIPRALRLVAEAAWWWSDTISDVAAELTDLANLLDG
jgi:hypothetical protein